MKNCNLLIAICFFVIFLTGLTAQNSNQNAQNIQAGQTFYKEKVTPKYQRRLQYYAESRGLDGPEAPANYNSYRKKLYDKEKKDFQSNSSSSSRSNSGEWNSDGPALFDNYESIGRINRINFHPDDPDIIYVATAGGGLWYTPNHGLVWYPLTDNIPNMNLSDMAISQFDPNVLYILTGDGDGMGGGAYGNFAFGKFSIGVLKSNDHGTTWERTGLSFDERDRVRAYNMVMHPVNSGIIYVASSAGIIRTINSGVSWDTVWTNNVYEVHYKPDDSQVMYALGQENFYKSIDSGTTWDTTAIIPSIEGVISRMSMATCESEPERVYLYAAPRNDSLGIHRGVFLSEDAGETFTKIDSTSNMEGVSDQGGYDLTIACSRVNSDNVIIGKVRAYRTTNSGDSFTFSEGLHADHHHFAINPLVPSRLYGATDGGLYYSDLFGAANSWTYMSAYMRITQYYRISVGQTNDQMVIGGSQDNGTHINDNANAVYHSAYGNDGMDCAIHPTDDNLVILSSQNGDFEISTDAGSSTSHLIDEDDIDEDAISAWVTPIAWDPTNADNIYLGYKPIYRSDDFGATFSEIPDTVGGKVFMHVGTEDPGLLYASDCYRNADNNCEYHIHRSEDYGTMWDPIHINMADSLIGRRKSYLTSNPDDSEEIWVTFSGFLDSVKVFRSINGGDSWTNASGSLPNIPINCIIQQDTDNNPSGAVYIGTDLGVYYRNDDLGDWIYFSNEMPAVEVSDLDIQYSSGTLYAGTYGRGIWTTELYSNCPNEYILNMNTLLPKKNYFFQANDSISLYDYTIESLGAHMKLKSDNVILISDGFVAKSDNGNLFKARLGPCAGGVETLHDEESDEEEAGKN